jgi:hypothetical protein
LNKAAHLQCEVCGQVRESGSGRDSGSPAGSPPPNTRTQCRAPGCTTCRSPFYHHCDVCGTLDVDHRRHNCPERKWRGGED